MRCLALLPLGVLLCGLAAAFAADPPTVTIPKLSKPLVEPAADDPHQKDYDKMWDDYEAAIAKARDGIVTALDKQIAKATEEGDLDRVEQWEAVKKQFATEGTLAWDSSAKAAAEWKQANPKIPFPRDFNDAVRAAVTGADSARDKLDDGYTSLVKTYTRAKNVTRAKDLREERLAVLGEDAGSNSSSPKAGAANSKKPVKAKPVVYRFANEADIKRDWVFHGDDWRIVNGSLSLGWGPSIESKQRYQGDIAVSVTFKGQMTFAFFGEGFSSSESPVIFERRGNTLIQRTASKPPTTLTLKESQQAVATSIRIGRASPHAVMEFGEVQILGTPVDEEP